MKPLAGEPEKSSHSVLVLQNHKREKNCWSLDSWLLAQNKTCTILHVHIIYKNVSLFRWTWYEERKDNSKLFCSIFEQLSNGVVGGVIPLLGGAVSNVAILFIYNTMKLNFWNCLKGTFRIVCPFFDAKGNSRIQEMYDWPKFTGLELIAGDLGLLLKTKGWSIIKSKLRWL
jgi:hypothetical protein